MSDKILIAENSTLVDGVLRTLHARYVLLDVVTRIEAHVRRRQAQGYYDLLPLPILARTLTEDLQSISKDKHLHVRAQSGPGAAVSTLDVADYSPSLQTRLLDGNVGYMELPFFPDPEVGARSIGSAMAKLAEASALIIDLRACIGGHPGMVALAASYLLGPDPVHLNSIYWRADDRLEEFWTSPEAVKVRFDAGPLYVITSRRTASAGEEFAYDLQANRRATVVGESTCGAAHPGDTHVIDRKLVLFVAEGRAINPITGTNWEGVGVVPDIPVSAASAVDVAHQHAQFTSLDKHRSFGH